MPLGGNWVETAWRASHTARHHTPAESSLHRHRLADSTLPPGTLCCPSPPGASITSRQAAASLQTLCFTISPGGTIPAARRPACRVTIVTGL